MVLLRELRLLRLRLGLETVKVGLHHLEHPEYVLRLRGESGVAEVDSLFFLPGLELFLLLLCRDAAVELGEYLDRRLDSSAGLGGLLDRLLVLLLRGGALRR